MSEGTKIPHHHFENELKKAGKSVDDLMASVPISSFWHGDEYFSTLAFPDGSTAVIGHGPEASAVLAQHLRPQTQH